MTGTAGRKRPINWSPAARGDLSGIWNHYLQVAGRTIADNIVREIGTVALLPIILGYIAFVYWVFWGKLREGEGYH